MFRKRRTGDRNRSRAAVTCALYKTCRTEGRQLVVKTVSKSYEPAIKEKIRRADRDNAIDLYIGDEYMDDLADGALGKYLH